MRDVIFVAVVIAFFAIAVAYVKGCARIVGDDDVVRVVTDAPDAPDAPDAGDPDADPRDEEVPVA